MYPPQYWKGCSEVCLILKLDTEATTAAPKEVVVDPDSVMKATKTVEFDEMAHVLPADAYLEEESRKKQTQTMSAPTRRIWLTYPSLLFNVIEAFEVEYVSSFESNITSTSEIMHNVSSETKTSNGKTEQVKNKKSNKNQNTFEIYVNHTKMRLYHPFPRLNKSQLIYLNYCHFVSKSLLQAKLLGKILKALLFEQLGH